MMETKLKRIAEIASEDKETKFSTLMYLVNEAALKECHEEMAKGKSPGVSGITKEAYGNELEENLKHLVNRMKKMSYKPQMVKRVYIPKAGSDKMRPLGIPEYEDKLVQKAMTKILNAIYEQDFLKSSMGFRKGISQHDALKVLNQYLEKRNTNYVVDADIKGFFDNVSHEWMMKFLGHRISDPKFLRMIARFLKSGYLEEGKGYKTEQGTPQGGVISPVLANIYLHYVLDLWFEQISKNCTGEAYMVRYADDFVCCFEYEEEAKMFYEALKKRLEKFSLEVAEDKTGMLPFGKNQSKDIKPGRRKSFDFLGFTHYCGKSKNGRYRVKRKMSRKKRKSKLKAMKIWIQRNMRGDIKDFMKRINVKLTGIYNYYCITDSSINMSIFRQEVVKLLYKWLNRRSQRKSFTWEKFGKFLKKYPLKQPKIKVSIYDMESAARYVV
jgi:RNA-directed DNA polymerase